MVRRGREDSRVQAVCLCSPSRAEAKQHFVHFASQPLCPIEPAKINYRSEDSTFITNAHHMSSFIKPTIGLYPVGPVNTRTLI